MRILSWVLMVWWSCVAWVGVAAGQGAGDGGTSGGRGGVIARVEWGWDGAVAAGRWAPVRVWLNGGGAGETSKGGMVVVEHVQDLTQSVRWMVGAATTPGRVTAHEVLVNMPVGMGGAKVKWVGQDGAEEELEYDGLGLVSGLSGDGSGVLNVSGDSRGIVAGVGVRSLGRAFPSPTNLGVGWVGASQVGEAGATDRWKGVGVATVEAGMLPVTSAAYQGLEALVVDGDSAAPSGAVSAVASWVRWGGTLVIVATGEGGGWRRWLGDDAGMVEVGGPGLVDAPSDLRAWMAREGEWRATGVRAVEREAAEGGERAGASTVAYAASDRMTGRLVRVTAAGERRGWTTRWRPGSGPEGLIAEGPVGLGWVVVLGVEPRGVYAGLDEGGTRRAWEDVLRVGLAGYLGRPVKQGGAHNEAVGEVLNAVLTVPELDRGMVWWIVGGVVLLAALLGPVDAVVLKRLGAGQRSWQTALVWVGVGVVVAGVMPRVVRTADSRMDRVVTVDGVAGEDGSVREGYVSGVTGLFAGRGGRWEPPRGEGAAWWHGVGVDPYEEFRLGSGRRGGRGGVRVFSPLQVVQAGVEGGERGTVVGVFEQGPWTYRSFADQRVVGLGWRAKVERDAGGYAVRIEGLGEGVSVLRARVLAGGGWSWVTLASEGGAWVGRAEEGSMRRVVVGSGEESSGRGVARDSGPGSGEEPALPASVAAASAGVASGLVDWDAAGMLAGAMSRGAAMGRMSSGGAWAVVEMELSGGVGLGEGIVAGGEHVETRRVFARVAALVSGGAGAEVRVD
ncbi:MAG: hypothetical protein HRU70_15520 [Phycisphaeraceae bacterium]|nr:MAG: hypothetical protein HRU70_15520 [Phycisphaeraceae bacterium]